MDYSTHDWKPRTPEFWKAQRDWWETTPPWRLRLAHHEAELKRMTSQRTIAERLVEHQRFLDRLDKK